MERGEVETQVRATFDTVADGYDHPGSSWFDATAQIIAREAQLTPGMRALDLATGTGKVALALAASSPGAQITGTDLSEKMLSQARRKAGDLGLRNVAFEQGSFDALDYGELFDVVSCSFGLFFVSHMVEALTHFGDQIKPGGKMIVSTFGLGSFSPLSDAFLRLYREYGFEVHDPPWLRIGAPGLLSGLFAQAQLPDVEVTRHDLSVALPDSAAWWDIVYNAGYRGMLEQLDEEAAPAFQRQHLAEVDQLIHSQGQARLPIEVLVAVASKR